MTVAFARRSTRALALSLLLSASFARPLAHAGRGGIDVEHFHPNIDGRGLFTAESAEGHGPWGLGLGAILHYARNPLVLAGDDRNQRGDLVSDRLTASILFSLGVMSWLEVGAALPVALANNAGLGEQGPLQVSGLGAMRFQLKLRFLRQARHGVSLALLPLVRIPTGNTNAFLGQNGLLFSPTLLLERTFGALRILLNVGATVREPARFLGLTIDDELFFRVGIGLRAGSSVELGAELIGTTAAVSPFGANEGQNPLEVLLGLRALLGDSVSLVAGGGLGVTRGYGAPGLRLFAGLVFAPRAAAAPRLIPPPRPPPPPPPFEPPRLPDPNVDTDGDGIPDKDDRCPTAKGPRANAGCPWPDGDGDGVPDKDDRCRDVPGPKKNRGCPWPDTDGDGITDNEDDCPTEAGTRQNRGCPLGRGKVRANPKDGAPTP